MSRKTTAFALALALPLSSLLVACGGGEDTPDRAALQREALERDLSLALQPDTTPQIALADVPLPDTTPAAAAPAPAAPKPAAQAPAPAPAPRRAERAPAPAPSRPAEPRYVTRTVPGGSTFSVSINQTL
ncbi:MAG TPA: hypothetical protein VFQ45_19565, partial [Longimicrobium sp.]|nr:hypothetical protein [Longimicrobium sp.]